jgi:hypothetical protein
VNSRWFNLIVIILALSISACGPAPQGAPSASPVLPTTTPTVTASVSPPQVAAVKPGSVSPPQVAAVKPGSVSLPQVAAVKPPEEKKLMGIQVFTDFEGINFFPRIQAVFSKPDKTPVASDFISEDGWGLSRNYRKVLPGEYYFLELSAPELLKPYFGKVSLFTGKVMPRFFFGSVSFQIGEEHIAKVNKGMKVKLNKQPEGELFFDGFFSDMQAVSIYGDTFPRMLVLEPGKYTYNVSDGDKKDTLIICDENGDEATMAEDSCEFTISREAPAVVIDISSYMGIKKQTETPGSR